MDPQGHDAGKKITGRNRHTMVGTLGIMVRSANTQDRDGAAGLFRQTRHAPSVVDVIFADAGYQGPIMAATVARTGQWRLEIVKRDDVPRSDVVPKRWIVERILAWISHFRHLARDFQRYARTIAGFIRLVMIRIVLRRLTRSN